MAFRGHEKPPRKVALFFNGTFAANQSDSEFAEHQKKRGFFHRNAAAAARRIMHNENNVVSELYDNCRLPNKKMFAGPGTDILKPPSEKESTLPGRGMVRAIKTLAGGALGNQGDLGIEKNIRAAEEFLKAEWLKAKAEEEAGIGNGHLKIYLCGWSRGAVTVDLLHRALANLIDAGQISKDKAVIQLEKIHVQNIDPVPGGDLERKLVAKYTKTDYPKLANPTTSTTYYSPTGNVQLWDSAGLGRAANLPLFSGLADAVPDSKKYIVPNANHEDIVSYAANQAVSATAPMTVGEALQQTDPNKLKKDAAGKVVRANIALEFAEDGLDFDPVWLEKVKSEGAAALQELENYRAPRGALLTRKLLMADKETNALQRRDIPDTDYETFHKDAITSLRLDDAIQIQMKNEEWEKLSLPELATKLTTAQQNLDILKAKVHPPEKINAAVWEYKVAKHSLNHLEQYVAERKLQAKNKLDAEKQKADLVKNKFLAVQKFIDGHAFKLHGGSGKRSKGADHIYQLISNALKAKEFSPEDYQRIQEKIKHELEHKTAAHKGFLGIGARDKTTVSLYEKIMVELEITKPLKVAPPVAPTLEPKK
jgi:hypothetical protein